MTDPEDTTRLLRDDLAETEVDEADEFERPLPIEADEADAVDQKLDVPDDDRDEY